MNMEKTSLEKENHPSCLVNVSSPLSSADELELQKCKDDFIYFYNKYVRIKLVNENINEPKSPKFIVGRIKSTCNKCRASESHNECSLGYLCHDYTPKEPCPKPLTIRQLIDAPKSSQ